MIHYKVVSGDTLSKIAAAHQTTAKVLLAANPYCVSKPGDAKTLRVGVVIHVDEPPVIPPVPEPPPLPGPQPPDIPANAVAATPSTLAGLINARPAGTAFALAPGVYRGTFPNKTENSYYGTVEEGVVFAGGVTYPNLATGTKANGGAFEMMVCQDGNLFAYLTIRGYRGRADAMGNGPLYANGADGVELRHLLLTDNQHSGLRFGGSGWRMLDCVSRFNGQYAVGGSGSGHLIESSILESCGDDHMVARGITPRFAAADRGISKFNHSTGITVRSCEIRNVNGGAMGLWFDGNNRQVTVEDNVVRDIGRHGIILEVGHDGIIRRNRVENCGSSSPPQAYRDAGIFVNSAGPATITDNTVVSNGVSRNGIVLYQPVRSLNPDYFSPVCGAVITGNRVEGQFVTAWLGIQAQTVEGCNPAATPSQVTFSGNTETGQNIRYWNNSSKTPAEWAALGRS